MHHQPALRPAIEENQDGDVSLKTSGTKSSPCLSVPREETQAAQIHLVDFCFPGGGG